MLPKREIIRYWPRALPESISYVDSPDFHTTQARLTFDLFDPSLPKDQGRAVRLTAVQERGLFSKFNYAKYRASRIPRRRRSQVNKIKCWLAKAAYYKDVILWHNTPMATYCLGKHAVTPDKFDDMYSVALASLNHTIDAFDYSRGFRFSTLAYTSLRQCLWRASGINDRDTRLGLHFTEDYNGFEPAVADDREACDARLDIKVLLDSGILTVREKQALSDRFGLRRQPQDLKVIANRWGVSRERVRQIERTAINKLRRYVRNREAICQS